MPEWLFGQNGTDSSTQRNRLLLFIYSRKRYFHLRKSKTDSSSIMELTWVHTRPGIPALVGLMMKRKIRIKFLHDIKEFYADSRVEGKYGDIKILCTGLFKLF